MAEQGVAQPFRQQEVIKPGRYLLRHIAPLAGAENEAGIVAPLGQGFTVLAQTLYAAELPSSQLPTSPDWTEGQYTLRLLDSGEFTITFPNKDASDGQAWRTRFDNDGHREFIEISCEGEVEYVGLIVKLQLDRQKVTLSGYDGIFLLKKAYVQDYNAVLAPRDVIEVFSRVPQVLLGEEFPGTSAPSGWFTETEGGGTVSFNNGAFLNTVAGKNNKASIRGLTGLNSATNGSRWEVRADITISGKPEYAIMNLRFGAETVASIEHDNEEGITFFTAPNGKFSEAILNRLYTAGPLTTGAHTFFIESDGAWVYGYFDGLLIGVAPNRGMTPIEVELLGISETSAQTIEVNRVLAREQRPFLLRGSEKGEYALPGGAGTYPTGGLHGRWRISHEPGSARWFQSVLAPDPRDEGFPDYVQNEEGGLTFLSLSTVPAGVSSEFVGVRWFGSVYLKAGANLFATGRNEAGTALRLYVGKTQYGQQLIDSWTLGSATQPSANYTAERDGWYPIIFEAARGAGGAITALYFTPPASYTDPGGTALTSGVQVQIPATSLSPLGCVDARYQGSSHFDIVMETAKAFGYQMRAEMRALETGEFPCQIIPKARVGRDTDEIVEADDIDRRSGINNHTSLVDATDAATSMRGFGSGIADGKGSQVAFEGIDFTTAQESLFDLQAWLSATDIAYPSLLAATVEAQLALRLQAWQNIEGDPAARPRLADTFPLTGALAAFHWLPSDGVRLWLPEVNIRDLTPRQIMQVTRSFVPAGLAGTAMGFRARPKDAVSTLRSAIREATRSQRAYQSQYVTRSSEFVSIAVAPGGFGGYLHLPCSARDRIVGATLHIVTNTTSQKLGLEVNNALVTTSAGGPWTKPTPVPVAGLMRAATGSDRVFLRLKNEGGAETIAEYQLVLKLRV